jgi:hypothetical protein
MCRRLEVAQAAAGLRRRWQVQPALLSVLHGCRALLVLLLSLQPAAGGAGRRAPPWAGLGWLELA